MHNSSSECKKLRTPKAAPAPSPARPKTEPFTLDIVPGGKTGSKAKGTAKSASKSASRPRSKPLNSRAPHDLVAALRAIVDESEIGGITPDQVAVLGRKWLMDRRHIKGLTARTLEGYKTTLERLVWFLETRDAPECGEDELQAFFAYCRDGRDADGGRWGHGCQGQRSRAVGMGPRTVRIHYNNLHAFFAWLVKKKHLVRSPFEGMEPPKCPQKEIQPFREEQVIALLNAAKESLMPVRNLAILLVLFDCGLRAAELCALERRDLNLEHRELRVRHGKGDKERTVIFSPATAGALCRYLESEDRHDEEALFMSQRGGVGLTQRGLHLLFKRLEKAAGISGVRCSPHTMRHAFASSYLMRGGSLDELQRFLGHTDARMTQHYVHTNRDYQREQHRRFSPVEGLLKKRK